MKVEICSRVTIEQWIKRGFPERTGVISFFSPPKKGRTEEGRVKIEGVCDCVFYVRIPDIDIELLADFGYDYESYLSEADELAAFIYKVKEEGFDLICQCDYGQSRSAACAAAILQHFEGRGIDVFADYRYYPNQLVYHKVLDALKKAADERKGG